jgi:hypothetical protein
LVLFAAKKYITFRGQQGHCGSPVALRQDAFIAAAQTTLDLREIALKYDSYCTVGNIEVKPDLTTFLLAIAAFRWTSAALSRKQCKR